MERKLFICIADNHLKNVYFINTKVSQISTINNIDKENLNGIENERN